MTWLGLEGKVAIVTGGASGIGKAICQTLAGEGASIAVADVDEKTAAATLSQLNKQQGPDHIFVKTDVTSRESVENLVAKTGEAFGRIDILVNNAGINIPRLLVDPAGKEELTEQAWDLVVEVNQKGAFLCAQATARYMIHSKREGVIINMASESGLEGS
ncbi:MAG: SDR family NAD(P)-dependent oxidoreductase, partial [Planctomycetota bacterium]|nr:SDR family NAD(P)-dependent oxidoreductase [Planctomycetota bacterium]